ncbi:sugar phosphate isomerase/epimerase [Listeria ivanovii]|uniref:sugar phosphate isomerase/epimerase family protein n=1 Tax=Listeria ivanovii TaxID=1638 RepID=UPI001623DE8C|nr:sugar phosphate isomerase/epimerase [Listeria ivanovii]MBC2255611.1 sugar phosphate isomerase/epimerase [Listeria ivanovii]MBK2003446.1 sugar phosphate isomerase/epimerase [Listeria ivanovii subsp. londoniensis]
MDIKDKIAVQLYSVRKEMERDLEGTFKKIHEIGFRYVQLDGMRGNDPAEVLHFLGKYELKVIGMHIKHGRFMTDLDSIIQEAYYFGCKTIFDKYIEEEDQNLVGYKATKEALIRAAQQLNSLGFRVGLHNPEYDFNELIAGRRVMDFITDPVNGVCIYAEPDTYWIRAAGHDEGEFMKRYSGRAPIVHMKDFVSGFELEDMDNNLVEIGQGEVDFRAIIVWGEANGVEYYCIEQDRSKRDMFDTLKASYNYLLNL